ncbi:hypothetical protein NUW58_g7099 [Xylaria curta]|uniref:Uncharacterized protein n=1 Tax=Xylaria curta TaxID=42375 RepID=A0ACC1NML9_9PEZI|nr:hypothetical protein NUW58_g7099 [Xylaria curta]
MSSVKLDPEWALMWQAFSLMPKPVINDVYNLRRATDIALAAATAAAPEVPEGIKETKTTITSVDGTSINVHLDR